MNLNFNEWLFLELSSKLHRDLENWLDENPDGLPFNDLFPAKNSHWGKADSDDLSANKLPVTRIKIPYSEDANGVSVLNKLKKLGHLDLDLGMLGKSRIGKIALSNKSPLTPAEKQWWNRQANPIKSLKTVENNDYLIIVSRNPIDIARMSDHDGWTSCHAPGDNYFQCTLADAKGSGGIAYIVNNKDIDGVNLQDPEIFNDEQRDIKGVKPLARLRLRKFVNTHADYDLAIPEDRVYGSNKFSGFIDTVKNWAFENQKDKIGDNRPSMDDFELHGGSYQDTDASDLFNSFFDDELDSGSVKHAGGEEANMADQYEEEVGLIEREFRDSFKFAHYYASVEGDNGDGEPRVYYSGSALVEIPDELMNHEAIPDNNNWKKRNEVRKAIKDALHEIHIYANGVEINSGEIRLDFEDEDSNNDPDSFRDFLRHTLKEVEDKKEEIIHAVYNTLVRLGLAKSNKVLSINRNLDDHETTFTNFKFTGESPFISISLVQTVNLGEISHAAVEKDFNKSFSTKLMEYINKWADLHFLNRSKQKSLFPDIMPIKRAFKDFKIVPQIALHPNGIWSRPKGQQPNLMMDMSLILQTFSKDEDVDELFNFFHFLDKNYDKFISLVEKTYLEMS
jgi:hypothetical protein